MKIPEETGKEKPNSWTVVLGKLLSKLLRVVETEGLLNVLQNYDLH